MLEFYSKLVYKSGKWPWFGVERGIAWKEHNNIRFFKIFDITR
jgi:hypothetical protein